MQIGYDDFVKVTRDFNAKLSGSRILTQLGIKHTAFNNHQLFHDGSPYHKETSPLICSASQWPGSYMAKTCAMKELKNKKQKSLFILHELWQILHWLTLVYEPVILILYHSTITWNRYILK